MLEYVEGEPLHGPMAVDQAVRLALQIASALEAAHQRGILHRDLKPANVLVTGSSGSSDPPRAKLLDFGIAKLMGALEGEAEDLTRTLEGAVVGTTVYMSPEQAEGKALDAMARLFQLRRRLVRNAVGHARVCWTHLCAGGERRDARRTTPAPGTGRA